MAKKSFTELQEKARKAAQRATSGCPLMEGREKADAGDYEGEELEITDAYPMNGDNGRYFCVTVASEENSYFLSSGGLTSALDEIFRMDGINEDLDTFREAVQGLCFQWEPKKKTRNGRTFRPITIL